MSQEIDMKRLHHGCGEALVVGQLRNSCAYGALGSAQQELRSIHAKLRFTYARSADNATGERR